MFLAVTLQPGRLTLRTGKTATSLTEQCWRGCTGVVCTARGRTMGDPRSLVSWDRLSQIWKEDQKPASSSSTWAATPGR